MTRHSCCAVLVALSMLFVNSSGSARDFFFDYTGVCVDGTLSCSEVDLNPGDPVTGSFAFNPATLSSNYKQPLISQFEFQFGNLHYSLSDVQDAEPDVGLYGSGADTYPQFFVSTSAKSTLGSNIDLNLDVWNELGWTEFVELRDLSSNTAIQATGTWKLRDTEGRSFNDLIFVVSANARFDDYDDRVSRWDLEAGEKVFDYLMDCDTAGYCDFIAESVNQLGFSPDGKLVVVGNNLGTTVLAEFDPSTPIGVGGSAGVGGFPPPYGFWDGITFDANSEPALLGTAPAGNLISYRGQEIDLGFDPQSIAVGPDDLLYASTGNNAIFKVDLDASLAASTGVVVDTVATTVGGEITFGPGGLM